MEFEKLTTERFGNLPAEYFEAYFNTVKKTVQEYTFEIWRRNRFQSMSAHERFGVILDDRGPLIDLYESCLQQDAHLKGVVETLKSQLIGERYIMATQTSTGQYIRDVDETNKIEGTQFTKIIELIAEAKLFGYSMIEIKNFYDPATGKLGEVNGIERRNVLPDQNIVVQRQGMWVPHWDIRKFPYDRNYILVNNGDLGLFSATTPLVLAKKFTWANLVSFAHTYGQPIIHGKTSDDTTNAKQTLANKIAASAGNRILVTSPDDSIQIHSVSQSNSERIYTEPLRFANKEISNLILGSESLAGETQSYVGSTKAHQDIYRERIEVYRVFIENVINEQIVPRLVAVGFLKPGRKFKYANRAEMRADEKIKLYDTLLKHYEVPPEEIEKDFGVTVQKQYSAVKVLGNTEKTNFGDKT